MPVGASGFFPTSMKWLQTLLTFILSNRQRFVWEMALAAAIWVLGYGLSWLTSQNTIQNCQDERTALLAEKAKNQQLIDSVYYAGKLAEKQQTINRKDEDIHLLTEKITRDSVRHLSELESMRAINRYIKSGRPTKRS